MFSNEELKKYAETLWWGLETARTKSFEPGDFVLVRFDLEALPLAEAVFELLLEKKINPVMRLNMSTTMEKGFYGKANDDQLTVVAPGDEELMQNLNGLISLIAPSSLTHLKEVNPARIGQAAVARKFLRDIMEKREISGDFGWTLCVYPTKAYAEAAGMSIEEFKQQVVKACFLNEDKPFERWVSIFNEAEKVKSWLNGLDVETLHLTSESMDLTVTPGKDRRWLGVSGHNIPSFEIFLSPDWRGTTGTYYADQPSFRSGNYVEGVRLQFENGKVVESDAKEGAEFVRKQLAMDEGACRLGEFSLTDRRFSQIDRFMANTLFDENFGGEYGNCHVAVGASYADTYAGDQNALDEAKKQELGFNDSALHWDLVNTEPKTVTATLKDGSTVLIYENGEFQQ
ncbi:aminopeptidase [Pseudodesulfovibrio senegalensis]|jgi:aminopeptidase|uniref:Aminopeptidase n=1 Tax=Pseudodesulfovibrio senegalensis TaxID=1721087 RepID=A0A6N6N581_9BACT|nr:aminopeptidase [Pseudodesulfovibrio senegalensis]KAB1443342.1 aminopeptidase [Pseudodesulfovibrio senegalensis]